MKNSKVLVFTLGGILAGIALGVLLAPTAGKDIRRKLKYSAGNIKKKLGLNDEEFSESELEMDATNGRSFGF